MATASYPIIGYDNLLRSTLTTLAASTTESGLDVDNIHDWKTYTKWRGTDATSDLVTADFGASTTISADYFGLIGHDLGTRGATIQIQHSTDASSYTTVLSISPSDDSPIFKTFTTATKRAWRIRLSGYSSMPFLSQAMLGDRLTLQRYPQDGFNDTPYKSDLTGVVSRTGIFLGSNRIMKNAEMELTFAGLTQEWFDSNIANKATGFWYNHVLEGLPFFFVPDETNYGYGGTDPRIWWVKVPDNAELDAPGRSVYRDWNLRLISEAL